MTTRITGGLYLYSYLLKSTLLNIYYAYSALLYGCKTSLYLQNYTHKKLVKAFFEQDINENDYDDWLLV